MKKETKQKIFIFFVILMFGSSSIAYVFIGFGDDGDELEVLTDFIVEHELNAVTEQYYIQRGYTFMRYLYQIKDENYFLLQELPDIYRTLQDQKQIIIERIESNITELQIVNSNNKVIIAQENLTFDNIYESLCNTLLSVPTECVTYLGVLEKTNARANTTGENNESV